ncbi:MAG: Rieske 2Fe-2S domain-containing protein, partial [Paracoccaceae bacterium]|nr:Rieske 2Fe-2S domain-containing protein [Paracoccaceae bacterium]
EIPEESFTLPSYMYTDIEIYELEKEKIFYKTWQYVAHKSLFAEPGDYVTLRICDQHIFVIMGDDSELRAFYNVCQHRAHELLPEGSGNVARAIVCPYHAWAFEKTGELRGAPRSENRPSFNKKDFSLKSVKLEMFLDSAFVNLDPNAIPLSEIAGDLEDDIRSRAPFVNELDTPQSRFVADDIGLTNINAGWKVVVDNYVECYHCEHAHKDFCDIISMDTYKHDAFGLWARQLGEDIKDDNTAYKLEPNAPFKKSAFWFLWPNTTINILPGAEVLNFAIVRPTAIDKCLFEGHSISTSEKFHKGRQDYTANVLVPEDIALCESVQRGLKSKGYDQGPLIVDPSRSGRGEHALHHFHRLVQKAMK